MNGPTSTARCVMLGAGQHARVLLDALQAAQTALPEWLIDRDPALKGYRLLGIPVAGGDEALPRLRDEGITHFVVGVGSTGDTALRRRIYEMGLRCGLRPLGVRHPTAFVSASARLGEGVQLLAGAIINTSAVLCENVLVNTGAIVEHDCEIGAHAHIATGARLGGAVVVGAAAHIGLGACVKQGTRVGARAVVGAGAVVIRDVLDGAVVAGVPARPLRRAA